MKPKEPEQKQGEQKRYTLVEVPTQTHILIIKDNQLDKAMDINLAITKLLNDVEELLKIARE